MLAKERRTKRTILQWLKLFIFFLLILRIKKIYVMTYRGTYITRAEYFFLKIYVKIFFSKFVHHCTIWCTSALSLWLVILEFTVYVWNFWTIFFISEVKWDKSEAGVSRNSICIFLNENFILTLVQRCWVLKTQSSKNTFIFLLKNINWS